MDPLSLPVRPDEDGSRLDVFLVRRMPGVGRAAAKEALEAGRVRVDGRRVRKGDRVVAGATVTVDGAMRVRDAVALPDPSAPLHVRFEDDALLVVDKPAGMPTHPLRADELGTLANALRARYPELEGVGFSPREPGLVHRLDTGTSGLVLVARSAAVFDTLVRALRAGEVDKHYLALVTGRVPGRFVVDAPLGPMPGDSRRVKVAADPMDGARPGFRAARTDVAPLDARAHTTLVRARAPSAARHQVRAHLAFAGHPLVGDVLYGGPAAEGLVGHFLHAASIALRHPTKGTPLVFESPLPADRQAVLDAS